jgi:hypothetical protein
LDLIEEIIPKVFKTENQPLFELKIPSIIKSEHGNEEVSDLNGLVIPCIYEYSKKNTSSIL